MRTLLIFFILILSGCGGDDTEPTVTYSSTSTSQNSTVVDSSPVSSEVIKKPDMNVVDIETRSQIDLLCQDDYFKSTNGYWNCLRKELKKIGVTPTEKPVIKPVVVENKVTPREETPVLKSKPDLSGLHELTKFITEQYCESYKKWGIQDYWGCLYRQIEESKKVSLPDLGSVYGETREIILESCEISLRWGVESFYGCLNDQLKSIGK